MAASMLTSKSLTSTAAFTRSAKAPAARRAPLAARAGPAAPDREKLDQSVFEYAKTMPGICDPFPNIFDPFNFLSQANSSPRPVQELRRWREAEITHGRVAMLAALGFIVGEQVEGLPILLNTDGHVKGPAIIHFQQVEREGPIFWEPLVFAIGICEAYRVSVGWKTPTSGNFYQLRDDYKPGELGFDPLGLCPPDGSQEKYDMQTKELNNGRLAMITIAGFVAQELVLKQKIFDHLFTRFPSFLQNTS